MEYHNVKNIGKERIPDMAVSTEFKETSSNDEIVLWESSPVVDIMIEYLQNLHQNNVEIMKVGISNNGRWAFRYEKNKKPINKA